MPRIKIDKDRCEGSGVCVSICPKAFKIGADGKAEAIGQECGDCDCQKAVDSCPTQAISLEE